MINRMENPLSRSKIFGRPFVFTMSCCWSVVGALITVFGHQDFSRAESFEALRAQYQSRIDAAADRGLAFLATQQISDDQAQQMGKPYLAGSFRSAKLPGNTGITSLGVMAFLSKGHTPGVGPYGSVLNRGIDYILSQQHENGLLIGQPEGRSKGLMYAHCVAALMLAEVSGMVTPKRQEKIDQTLPYALLVLLQSQNVPKNERHVGGWRYMPGGTDSDISLTGWAIMALRAARLNGATIPDSHIEAAIAYILNCRNANGGFSYQPGHPSSKASFTGIAILCLELCGEHGHESVQPAADYLMQNLPQMVDARGSQKLFRYYAFYYCSQAMFQIGGDYWRQFAPRVYDALLQDQRADGSWQYPAAQPYFEKTYPTAMAILTLTVSARQLPIYQRDESLNGAGG